LLVARQWEKQALLNLAHNVAAFHKLPVAIFSLEMSKEQLAAATDE